MTASDKQVQLTISNIVGQVVYKQGVTFSSGIYKLQLPRTIQPDIYLLKITDADNHEFNLKFVVE